MNNKSKTVLSKIASKNGAVFFDKNLGISGVKQNVVV